RTVLMTIQAVCRGGSFAVESVAAFAWNGWQASSGISGNLGLEYAVWDSVSEIRYLVMPERPENTEHLSEAELIDLISRDHMIGVARDIKLNGQEN
ncbi:MAG: nitrile hydratase subunit alpha, partial [Marinobacter sp.]|nr:nitrile hydratase subunit alpha [Marinobacter sp.]